MRHSVTATDAKNRFADALRRAEGGEVVTITRFRKPAAAIIGAERLARLERLAARAEAAEAAAKGEKAAEVAPARTLEELLEGAAEASRRRIDYDLANAPEESKRVLRLMRENLFQRRLTLKRMMAVLDVGDHDLTSRFKRQTGASIYKYLEERRSETAGRLLVETELEVEAIGRMVGYGGAEGLARAFQRWAGVRPLVYREFGGRLSQAVAGDARADRAPAAPRYLAGVAAVAGSEVCARCGGVLEGDRRLRVFEALAPICDGCAGERAGELAERL